MRRSKLWCVHSPQLLTDRRGAWWFFFSGTQARRRAEEARREAERLKVRGCCLHVGVGSVGPSVPVVGRIAYGVCRELATKYPQTHRQAEMERKRLEEEARERTEAERRAQEEQRRQEEARLAELERKQQEAEEVRWLGGGTSIAHGPHTAVGWDGAVGWCYGRGGCWVRRQSDTNASVKRRHANGVRSDVGRRRSDVGSRRRGAVASPKRWLLESVRRLSVDAASALRCVALNSML